MPMLDRKSIKSRVKGVVPAFLWEKPRLLRAWWMLTSARAARKAVGEVDDHWRGRIDDVIACPDNAAIDRDPEAGKLDGHVITMHNGVRVCANGYYGGGILNMLIENRGVHEPQEERAFEAVIEHLPAECTMLELGAYWGLYSLSLLRRRPNARCFLVEPIAPNLLSGQMNFRLNGRQGVFVHAGVDRAPRRRPRTISVDSFCRDRQLKHLNILHADIQGHEALMLEGARDMLSGGKVDFVFISTHSNALHAECIERLESAGYVVLAEADLDATFSWDGLIVAKHKSVSLPEHIQISKKASQPPHRTNAAPSI